MLLGESARLPPFDLVYIDSREKKYVKKYYIRLTQAGIRLVKL